METYQHSGKIPAQAFALTPLAGCGVGLVLGVIYTYIVAYCPFVYGNILATAGLGIALGYVVGQVSKTAKVRNALFILGNGFLAASVALYAAWAFHAYALFGNEVAEGPLWNPLFILAYMAAGYENGFWAVGRNAQENVSGLFLAAVWLIEAGIVYFLAVATSYGFSSSLPFCEKCECWTDENKSANEFQYEPNVSHLSQMLHTEGVSSLNKLQLRARGSANFTRLDLNTCPNCEDVNYLSLYQCVLTVDKDGNSSTEETPIVENAIITLDEADLAVNSGVAPSEHESGSQYEVPTSKDLQEFLGNNSANADDAPQAEGYNLETAEEHNPDDFKFKT